MCSLKASRCFIISIIAALFVQLAFAIPVQVGSFNINSGRASALNIVRQMNEQSNIDIWGISESSDDWATKIISEINKDRKFNVIKGTSGIDSNRLQIYYNTSKYHLVEHKEIDEINRTRKVRAPLVAEFIDLQTKKSFLFMVNHLYRRDGDERLYQAEKINLWARLQNLPVIAVGDYNFDMSPYNILDRGAGFDALTKDRVFTWIQPEDLLPTQCSKYNSILDFIFVSNKMSYTNAKATIEFAENDYCANNKNSDHRPVVAVIDMN